jgi:hypothetical protein
MRRSIALLHATNSAFPYNGRSIAREWRCEDHFLAWFFLV